MVTKDTKISEIVYNYPELIDTLQYAGIFCFSWGGRPAWGALALHANLRGLSDKNLDELVKKLNEILENKQSKKAS